MPKSNKNKPLPQPVFHKHNVYVDLKDAIKKSNGDVRLAKARMAAQELAQDIKAGKVY